MLKPLIVIAGQTACGKTQTAVALAKKLGTEIVSADSMQVYKGMDIGTAKPTAAERAGIVHHLIDVVWPDEPFAVAQYQQAALSVIAAIHAKNKIPILTGGTGFYINSVVYGCTFTPMDKDDAAYREQFTQAAQTQGVEYVHRLLAEVDPETAQSVHPNNVRRVVRALAFYHASGEKLSAHNAAQKQHPPLFNTLYVLLDRTRETLYARINARVWDMVRCGLVEEVESLLHAGYAADLPSMQGLGYKEIVRYLQGRDTLVAAIEAVQQGTRRYAKRQWTWFTRQSESHRISVEDASQEAVVECILLLAQKQRLLPVS